VAASGWLGQSESLIGGAIDWSTANFDQAETGLWRAGLGLDMGRVGPVWARPAQTRVKRWLCPCGSLGPKRALARVGVAHGFSLASEAALLFTGEVSVAAEGQDVGTGLGANTTDAEETEQV
jgi:hypothetical protein